MSVQLANSTIGNYLADIQTNLNTAIVSPLNAFGLGGFVFDIEDDSSTFLTSDITDHFVENNTTIQDHIAIKPLRVTLKNFVGEVVDRRDNTTNTLLQRVAQKLTTLTSYLPTLSQAATQLQTLQSQNTASITAQDITNPAANLYALVKNAFQNTTKQQQAYQFFKALQQQKILIGVQTAHEFLTNMAIESVVAQQTGVSKYISNFTVTLKQIRFAQTLSVSGLFVQNGSNPQASVPTTAADTQGALQQQIQEPVQQGLVSGTVPTPAEESLTEVPVIDFTDNLTEELP